MLQLVDDDEFIHIVISMSWVFNDGWIADRDLILLELNFGEVVYGVIILLNTLYEIYTTVIIDVEGYPCIWWMHEDNMMELILLMITLPICGKGRLHEVKRMIIDMLLLQLLGDAWKHYTFGHILMTTLSYVMMMRMFMLLSMLLWLDVQVVGSYMVYHG